MEVQNGKGGIYPLAIVFVMVMLLINPYCCAGAAVVVKSNTTTVRYNNGRLEESLIEYDLELELLMNPYATRILAGVKPSPSPSYEALDGTGIPCNPDSKCHGGAKCPGKETRSEYYRCPP